MAKAGKIKPTLRSLEQLQKERKAAKAPQLGFFSVLDEAIQQAPFENAPVSQWQSYLQPGRQVKRADIGFPLKQEEIDYALSNILGGKYPELVGDTARLPKDKLLDLVRNERPNFGLTVRDDVLNNGPDPQTMKGMDLDDPSTWSNQYAAITKRLDELAGPDRDRLIVSDEIYGPGQAGNERLSHQSPGSRYQESITRLSDINFGQHFDRDGLSHSRTSSHPLSSGEKLRLIEEIQSDLHQAAAKRVDWREAATPEEVQVWEDLNNQVHDLDDLMAKNIEPPDAPMEIHRLRTEQEELEDEIAKRAPRQGYISAADKKKMNDYLTGDDKTRQRWLDDNGMTWEEALAWIRQIGTTQVPDAPFKEPRDYGRLELRKQLLNAANNDEDYLALTKPSDQMERYGMEESKGMEHVYGKVYKSELEKLAKQYGAETTLVDADMTTQAPDMRTPTMHQFGWETVEDVEEGLELSHDYVNVRPGQFALNIPGATDMIDDLAADNWLNENGYVNDIERLQKLLKKVQDENPNWQMGEDDPDTGVSLDDLHSMQTGISELLGIKFAHDKPSSTTQTKTFPAIKLTPEIREKIKQAGVPLWALGAGAAGLEMTQQEEPGMAKGGKVSIAELKDAVKNHYRGFGKEMNRQVLDNPVESGLGLALGTVGGYELLKARRERKKREEREGFAEGGLAGLKAAIEGWNEFMLPGGVPGETARAIKDQYPDDYVSRIAKMSDSRKSSKEGLKRIAGAAAANIYGANDKGEVGLPGLYGTSDKSVGLMDQTMALPAAFGTLFGANPDDWPMSQAALARTEATEEAIQKELGYSPADDPGEYLMESAGSMLGQPPIPVGGLNKLTSPFAAAGKWARETAGPVIGGVGKAAAAVPGSLMEFFAPFVEAKAGNYLSGTLGGAALRTGVDAYNKSGEPSEAELEELERLLREDGATLEGPPEGYLDDPDMDEVTKRLITMQRKTLEENPDDEVALAFLERNDPSFTQFAKGGKVITRRGLFSNLLKDPGVETGKGMVPVQPEVTANLPAESGVTPTMADIEAIAERVNTPQKGSLLETPISRRTVLEGMGALLNPINPLGMADIRLDDLAASLGKVTDVAAPLEGVIARMNDREGFEMSAWGKTAADAYRALVNDMAGDMTPNKSKPHGSAFETIDQITGTLDEFGVDYSKGTQDEIAGELEDVMPWFRAEYAGDIEQASDPKDLIKELTSGEEHIFGDVIKRLADETGQTPEELQGKIIKQLEHEQGKRLIYDPEGPEWSPKSIERFKEILGDRDSIENIREYQIDDLKAAHPDMSWAEAVELRRMIESYMDGTDPLTGFSPE